MWALIISFLEKLFIDILKETILKPVNVEITNAPSPLPLSLVDVHLNKFDGLWTFNS